MTSVKHIVDSMKQARSDCPKRLTKIKHNHTPSGHMLLRLTRGRGSIHAISWASLATPKHLSGPSIILTYAKEY